jgi:TolB protein
VIAYVLAGAILVGGHTVARGVQPAWSRDGTLAYVRDGVIHVGASRFPGETPAWSPDGTRLAFVRRRGERWDVWTARADGSRARVLVRDAVQPAWSPDGRRVAYASNRLAENQELWVVRSDGTGARRLTRAPLDDAWPAFSPDGRTIAYTHAGAIWTMRSDGSARRLLVDLRGRDDWRPAYSPDGRTIAFTSLRLGGSLVYTVGRDGARLRRVGPGGDATFARRRRRTDQPTGGRR